MTNIFQRLYYHDLEKAYTGFHGIIFDNVIGEISDLQIYFENVGKEISSSTEILISYHNPLWEPILGIASFLGLRRKIGVHNWLDRGDLENILTLAGFEIISTQSRFLGITLITIAKLKIKQPHTLNHKYGVSIIIPARNEEGNILKIIPSIPVLGKFQEYIFIEGHSVDKTWEKIIRVTKTRKNVKAFKQKGKGKADAVHLGLLKAKGDVIVIYDADRTVDANDLPKFYQALTSNSNTFINGSRLVYPMEQDAMQTLNKIANQIFSWIFTWILNQRFKDTLCGTKAFFRDDFLKYKNDYERYLKIDPFGDFALIFTAIKHKMKVIEIPVRYKERVYGSTNINRFYHGLLLFKMAIKAFLEFKT